MKISWLILASFLLGQASSPAQDLQSLFKAASGTEVVIEKETAAEEQLPWAKDQLAAAQKAAKDFEPENFAQQLTAVGLPASRAEDLKSDLEATVRSYGAGIDALAAVVENRSALEAAKKAPMPSPPLDDKGVDDLHEQSGALRRDISALETQIGLDVSYLERQKVLYVEASRELRRLNEEFADATAAAQPRAALLVRLAEARALAASSSVFAVSWRMYSDQLEKERLELTTRQINTAKSASGLDTIFGQSRARAGMETAAKDIQSIEANLNEARETSAAINQELTSLREQTPPDENSLRLIAEAASIVEKTLRGYELWLAGAQLKEKSWRSAAAVAASPESPEVLVEARDLAAQATSSLTPWRDFLRKNISDADRNHEALLNSEAPEDAAGKKLRSRVIAYNKARLDQLRSLDTYLEELLSLAERLLDESRERLVSQSLKAKATHAAGQFQDSARKFWNTEVFTTDQPFFAADGTPGVRKRGVTLGRLGLAILVALVTILLAKRFARLVTANLRSRFSMDHTRIEFLERAIFFSFAGLIILTALNWLHIPLTAFAFMGGALAIGIGFGVQTLMNNFISGMILTAERCVKVGDVVDVDGHHGTVLSLGTRCSTIRKFDGIEVLVPNSYLLEKNVENWTMSDPHHRFDFVVGVDYGADTDLVQSLLIDAVKSQPGIAPSPAPSVFFEQFGDNSLNFRIYFWIDIRKENALHIGSEIRLRINRSLREEGIGIAYPQRDIHFHAAKPIQVELRQSPDVQEKPDYFTASKKD
jgi:small-conductance mechanosensitive channel